MIRRRLVLLALPPVLVFCAAAHAAERVLYEKASPYSTIVVTEDDQALRTLRFERNGARQSVVKVGDPDHMELAYTRAMLVGLAFVEPPKRVLVVGLGGGTLPNVLRKHYPGATIDAVDIDPDVVRVAKEFFGFREDAAMRAHVEDGRRFIENCREPYDLIFLDAFGADDIPYHLTTQQFLRAVHRALSPTGAVVANVWGRDSNPLYDSMVRTYQDVFDELYTLDVEGGRNKVLLALPCARRIARDDLARRAGALSTEKHLRFDLGELVRSGFRRERKMTARGSVLMDRKATATASTRPTP